MNGREGPIRRSLCRTQHGAQSFPALWVKERPRGNTHSALCLASNKRLAVDFSATPVLRRHSSSRQGKWIWSIQPERLPCVAGLFLPEPVDTDQKSMQGERAIIAGFLKD